MDELGFDIFSSDINFGNNSREKDARIGELFTRQQKGEELSREEEEELKKLLMRKMNTPEVFTLLEKAEVGDPNVKMVNMGQGDSITVSPTDQQKTIFTVGLNGCSACLHYTEYPDGTRNVILTHYPPTDIQGNLAKLRELIGKEKERAVQPTKQTTLIFAKKGQRDSDILSLFFEVELGDERDVKLVEYSSFFNLGKDNGTLLVRIPPKEKGKATYRTWFGGGLLGEQGQEK